MIKRLVIGTGNQAKVKEWSEILGQYVSIGNLSDFEGIPKAIESGDTIEENARQKAIHYAKLTHEYVMSEDGGFEIDALGGLPGARSHRLFGNKEATDEEIIDFVLEKMKDTTHEKRTARMASAVAISNPLGEIIYEDKTGLEGIITKERGPVLLAGYPYRTILYIPDANKTYAELSHEEYEKISPKKRLGVEIIDFLKKYNN